MLPVALLAGGLATRLHPQTQRVPKALLPVAGRPFIHWQLELLARQGITRAVLCVGFLGEQIRDAVGDGAQFDLALSYSFDGETLLGTGGALKRALPLLGSTFFVLYGDSYLPCSFTTVQAVYEASPAPGLMTVLCNENRRDRSNVLLQRGKLIEYNKRHPSPGMRHVDYGLAVLSAHALRKWPNGVPFDLADVYHDLSLRGELVGLEVNERFYEIGSPQGRDETDGYLRTLGH